MQTEQNYTQIEKELLAVVFSCEHFEHYIYGNHIQHSRNRPQATDYYTEEANQHSL